MGPKTFHIKSRSDCNHISQKTATYEFCINDADLSISSEDVEHTSAKTALRSSLLSNSPVLLDVETLKRLRVVQHMERIWILQSHLHRLSRINYCISRNNMNSLNILPVLIPTWSSILLDVSFVIEHHRQLQSGIWSSVRVFCQYGSLLAFQPVCITLRMRLIIKIRVIF